MSDRVPQWVRLGVGVAMAAPQLVIGLWATLAPADWFDHFPGFDPRLVAAEPPYNRHLASDAGAGFLATGVALLFAALWANRAAVWTALLAMVAFTLPHVLYHALHPSALLSGGQDALNVASLSSGLALAALFAWGSRPSSSRAARPGASPARAPSVGTAS
jgi:hypothetical protein